MNKTCQFCGRSDYTYTITNKFGEYPEEEFTVCSKCWDTFYALLCTILPYAFEVYTGQTYAPIVVKEVENEAN